MIERKAPFQYLSILSMIAAIAIPVIGAWMGEKPAGFYALTICCPSVFLFFLSGALLWMHQLSRIVRGAE